MWPSKSSVSAGSSKMLPQYFENPTLISFLYPSQTFIWTLYSTSKIVRNRIVCCADMAKCSRSGIACSPIILAFLKRLKTQRNCRCGLKILGKRVWKSIAYRRLRRSYAKKPLLFTYERLSRSWRLVEDERPIFTTTPIVSRMSCNIYKTPY